MIDNRVLGKYVDREPRLPIETSCMTRPNPSRTIRDPSGNILLRSQEEQDKICLRKVGDRSVPTHSTCIVGQSTHRVSPIVGNGIKAQLSRQIEGLWGQVW